ncbi:hypothetical protein BDA96_06G005700 [Sorghum bicolor]|uniref:Uncharacterized protein n=2 Tax=Sorghum bicolor TaxID=4558 RepID=A0A921UBN9_SORBI|nr:hypothetical protein SORBI_3006G005700 [Sorghum bicolor]KAG0524875.1 hypothetical protein BDA96_06G005700 [Sorghum bicolor]
MARSRLQLAVLCILLCCIVVDSAAESFTHRSSDGAQLWGYVQVRKGAYLFWYYYKSPQGVPSPGKPWPTVLYTTAPASSGHGNFKGIGPLDLNQQPHNSTWLNKANLLFVDTPVGTGYSYEEDGNIMRRGVPQTFSEAAADILELLRVLTGEIPTLQSSPLFLLHSTYGGTYAGKITNIVAKAILAAAPLIILRSEEW